MTARPPREHDPRITVIQQELCDDKRSKGDKYRELFVGQPGAWAISPWRISSAMGSSSSSNSSSSSQEDSSVKQSFNPQ